VAALGSPAVFVAAGLSNVASVTYDGSGTVYADGLLVGMPEVAVMRKHDHRFKVIGIHGDIGELGAMQWDGTHLDIENYVKGKSTIGQFGIGRTLNLKQSLLLKGSCAHGQFSIFGSRVVVTDAKCSTVKTHAYPSGELLKRHRVTNGLTEPKASVVSAS
jgi:hypothetical protein